VRKRENTAPALLAACVLLALPSSGLIRHNIFLNTEEKQATANN
jgi:hypothetical protein